MNFEIIGLIAGVLTTAGFIPQIYRGWKTKHLEDLSIAWMSMLGTGLLLWLVYGLSLGNTPIILTNGVSLVCVIVIICMKFGYSR